MNTDVSAGEVRRNLVELCNQGQFFAAHMRLLDSGLDAHLHPSLWELVERRAVEAGEDALAHNIRRALLAADIPNLDAVLNQARYEIQQGHPARARAHLEQTFGAAPDNSEARILLGVALATEDRDRAIDLLTDAESRSETELVWAVDALRDLGEQKHALRLCRRARALFPLNTMLLNRLGWIAESVGDFETATNAAELSLNADPDARARALNRLVRLHRRLGDKAKSLTYAAQLLAMEASPRQKLLLARTLGHGALLRGIVGSLPGLRARGGIEDAEAERVLTFLLDEGHVGLALYLWREGFPMPKAARQVLTRKGLAGDLGTDLPNSVDEAERIRSPAILFPLYPDRAQAPLPAGWRATLRGDDKILLVNSVLAAGGAERQFLMVARALVAAGLDPNRLHATLFSIERDRGHGHFEDQLRATGIHVHDLSKRDLSTLAMPERDQDIVALLPSRLRGDVLGLYDLTRQLKPAVIHGWQDRASVASGLVSQMLDVRRTLLSVRNMRPRKRGDEADWIARAIYSDLLQKPAVAITANATEAARDYEDWLDLPQGAVSVLANAVDETVFYARPTARPAGGPIRILGIFRLAENKRPLLWVETMAALRAQHGLNIAPRIVGAGPLTEEVRRHADRLGLGDLRLDPPVQDPSQIYRDSDLLVLLSQVEGTPNVVLEAQVCGLPVAACNVGGVAEALHQGGPSGGLLLAPEITAAQAAEAIARWVPAAVAADRTARERFVLDRYSMSALANRLLDLYGARP